ncbi:heparinase II/III family protein [Massilia sp. H6]|uniref:heparinase II/III domain-containing protein n=1 Tax=Massilia sp. H6 TaxID=2970464 RepID=UPI002166C197|nr:heparinase II/III family protein [Massilia sp. H6]UVW29933.1 heparinase II/III family protein [Massilia sp. H6]
MQFHPKSLLWAAAFASLCASMGARADWAQSTDPLVIQAKPELSQVQAQNPPGFTWSRHATGPASYEIEITPVGGMPSRVVVERNWHLPTKALALGNYTWRVRPVGTADWSNPRTFSITSKSVAFEVPDNATVRNRILAKARPRSLPASVTPFSTWNTAKRADLEPYLSRLGNEVKSQVTAVPALSDSRWSVLISSPLTAAMAAQQTDVRQRINEATRQLEAAALMYRIKGEAIFLAEALKRGDQLAALDPNGPTSYVNQDQATRQIAWGLIKGIDLLGSALDANRKAQWLAAVKTRTTVIYNSLAGNNGRLDQFPFDSHGNTSLVFLVLISSLSLGDIPDAQKWFDFSFRAYALSPNPWSGPEGGYANGTAYAEYAAAYLLALWDPLSHASGVNFFGKPWTLGFLDFAMEFIPPGARVHAFGDASETRPDPRVFRAFASRMWSPRAAWFVKNTTGLEDAMSLLSAQYPLPVTDTKVYQAPSNSAYYPSIGWVAMHSDLAANSRISTFFKSSPYGSFNHSHGDQNGLLLSSAGQPLLVKAGWYDWYGSPYWSDWYHQTRSQNAITFDGGKGQLVNGYREQLQRNGKITAFTAQPTYDYTEGDATPAYGGQLSMARRQVWHLRSAANAVLVRDRLASSVARTYEWNMHTPAIMTVENPLNVKVTAGGQMLCVRSLNTGATFAKWIGPAAKANVVEDHGAFYLKSEANAIAEYLVLLDVGCLRPTVTMGMSGSVRTVSVGGQTVTLN